MDTVLTSIMTTMIIHDDYTLGSRGPVEQTRERCTETEDSRRAHQKSANHTTTVDPKLHSCRRGVLGTRAHTPTIKPIIETTLSPRICQLPSLVTQLETEHSQRLQHLDANFGRERDRDEREERRPRLSEARDPADAPREEPWGEDVSRVVHHERVHGP